MKGKRKTSQYGKCERCKEQADGSVTFDVHESAESYWLCWHCMDVLRLAIVEGVD